MSKVNDTVTCVDDTVARFYSAHRSERVDPVNTTDSLIAGSWDYAVADALRKKASDAIDEYNAYVDKQPTTTYYKLHKGY